MAAVTRKLLVIEIKFQIRRHFGILRNVHAGFQGLTVFYHAIMEESFLNYTLNDLAIICGWNFILVVKGI